MPTALILSQGTPVFAQARPADTTPLAKELQGKWTTERKDQDHKGFQTMPKLRGEKIKTLPTIQVSLSAQQIASIFDLGDYS